MQLLLLRLSECDCYALSSTLFLLEGEKNSVKNTFASFICQMFIEYQIGYFRDNMNLSEHTIEFLRKTNV